VEHLDEGLLSGVYVLLIVPEEASAVEVAHHIATIALLGIVIIVVVIAVEIIVVSVVVIVIVVGRTESVDIRHLSGLNLYEKC